MSFVNTLQPKLIRCDYCQTLLSESMGTESYCLSCGKIASQIQHELKAVPHSYRSNWEIPLPPKQRRFESHLKKLAEPYVGSLSSQLLNEMTQKSLHLQQLKGFRSKGQRESAAAIVYFQFLGQHKLSIKQFCAQHNLQQKVFNSRYISFRQEYPADTDVKIEPDDEQTRSEASSFDLQTVVCLLFDHIFTKPFFQQVRSEMIESLSQRIKDGLHALLELTQSEPHLNNLLRSQVGLFYVSIAVFRHYRQTRDWVYYELASYQCFLGEIPNIYGDQRRRMNSFKAEL